MWKYILAGRKPILKGARFKLGNGYGINPCRDPWLPHLEDGIPRLKDGINPDCVRRVSQLKDLMLDDWDV